MNLPEYVHLLKVPFGERFINLVLISGDLTLLVDSGMSYSFEPYVLPGLKEMDVSPAKLDWLVNLHAHSDHIGGNALLFEASQGQLRIACHKNDAPYIREPMRVVRDLYGMPKDNPRFDSAVQNCGKPAPVHLELVDGVIFDLGQGVRLEIIAAPGHSPGNIAIYDRASKTLIHGESIMGPPQPTSDGRLTTPFSKQPIVYRRTLERLSKLPIEQLVFAHQETMGAAEAQDVIRTSIEGVDAFLETLRWIGSSGASFEKAYDTMNEQYRLPGPKPLQAIYDAVRAAL